MVFYAYVLVLCVRNLKKTANHLKEITTFIFNNEGCIRSLSHEGIMQPLKIFFDSNNQPQTYARYVTMQIDLGEEANRKLKKICQDHADILQFTCRSPEAKHNISSSNTFLLDYFTKREEELNWPPQATADVLDYMDMNWKEFSRTRWSSYLRT